MPQRGRPPQPGTAEEKAAIRREKVRLYVKAHRERKKNAGGPSTASEGSSSEPRSSTSPPVTLSSSNSVDSECDECDDKDTCLHKLPLEPKTEPEEIEPSADQWLVRTRKSVDSNKHAAPAISVGQQGGRNFTMALMGTFRGQFLPTRVCVPGRTEFGSELVTPCSAWITTAYGIALQQDSGALKSSILAVGLALTGMQYQDERLKVASIDVYRKALRQVRTDLKPLTTGKATNYLVPYLSCLAAAMFEMVHDGFSENIMQHVKGATSLMELLPRDANVNHLLSDLLLEDLCMWEIVFALKYRYPSPLRSLRQRKGSRDYKVAGDAESASRNATVLGDLLDGADEIPAVMSRVDELRTESHSKMKGSELQTEMGKLARILNDLDQWAIRFHIRFGPIYIQIDDLDSVNDLGTPTLRFRSYEIAAAWVYCLTFLLCGLETNIEALTEFLHLSGSQCSPPTTQTDTTKLKIVPNIVPQVQYHPGYESYLEGTDNIKYETLPMKSEHDFLHKKLTDLRSKLRSNTTQLIEAMCIFISIPKGIIGQSLVLFPLDRCKAMLKRELARLSDDLTNMKTIGVDDDMEILQNIGQLSQAMTVYETLEQTLLQFGMPPMPED